MATVNGFMPGEWDWMNGGIPGAASKFEGLLGNPALQMGLGILSNNQGNYGQFGPAFGRGIQQGLQNVQASKQFGLQNKLYELKLKEAEREIQDREDKRSALPRMIKGEDAYTTTQQVPITSFENVPVTPQEGAVAPNFNLQRHEVTTMQDKPVFNEDLWMRDVVASGYGDMLLKAQLENKFKQRDPIKVGQGDVILDPVTMKPVYTAPQTPEKLPSAVQEYEYAVSQGYPGSFQQFQLEQRKAGASKTNVNVSTDKKYGEIFGTRMAEQDATYIDAAKTAPDRVASARRVMDILDKNPTTGTGAEARLGIEKAFATAGLVDGENVKNTEDLAAELASTTLEAIKSSGLGSGQGFTDKDRQFLERARAGNIEVNPQTLRRLAHLNELSAIRSIERGNDVIRKLKADPSLGDVAGRLEEVMLPGAASAIVQPPKQAINALRMNPKLRDQFDQKYGPGAAAKVLGRR